MEQILVILGHGDAGMTLGQLAVATGRSVSSISRRITELERAGAVRFRAGRWVVGDSVPRVRRAAPYSSAWRRFGERLAQREAALGFVEA